MRKQATSNIINCLKERLPNINWSDRVRGSERGDEIMGTLVCEQIYFKQQAKDIRVAYSTFQLYIIDLTSVDNIEDIADEVIDVITEYDEQNEFFYKCSVKSVKYGQAQGMPDAGLALIEIETEYNW